MYIFDALTSGLKIKELQGDLLRNFPHQATKDQIKLISEVAGFLLDKDPHQLFVLKGYAGTGKTTLIQSIIRSLIQSQVGFTRANRKSSKSNQFLYQAKSLYHT